MAADRNTLRTLYQGLLNLYPRAFREQLGESMAQTFTDLCRERHGQPTHHLLGFVLWAFADTALGILREHSRLIKEMNPMKNLFASFRTPALIGLLLVLPFMLIEFTTVMVKRLQFDLRDALDSTVIFGLLWLGLTAIVLILMPVVRYLRSGPGAAAEPVATQEFKPTQLLTHPASAAVIGFILALPFLTLLTFMLLGIEPTLGPLDPLLKNADPDQPNVLSAVIVIGALLLCVLAGLIVRGPIVQTIRSGGSLLAHPANLLLAVVIVAFIARLVIGLIVDQYPCWIGVPNCD